MADEIPENQLRKDIRNAMSTTDSKEMPFENTPPGVDNSKDSTAWQKEIKSAEKDLDKWHNQAKKIVDRYLDKRGANEESMSKVNLFTTNTGILLSTLYARFPKPLVTREWEDSEDAPARVAAIILERNLRVKDRDSFDVAMRHIVLDRLVPGLGQLWFRYDPTIVTEPNPAYVAPVQQQMPLEGMPPDAEPPPQVVDPMAPPPEPEFMDRLVDEEVATDYVNWEDFIWSPCRTWEECRWVGRKVKMTKADVEKRFGSGVAGMLKYKKGMAGDAKNATNTDLTENQEVNYATVVEIWNKRDRMIYWVCPGFPKCLDCKPDPFKLQNFWPCPKPLHALTGTSSTVPRPDYLMIQDQYEELDMVNNRITMLERAIKVVGVYDKTNKEIGRIFTEGLDNTMIAADNFGQFSEKGGMKGMIDWVPIEAVVNALEKLKQVRMDLVAQIYELTGISDIMRGSTKASETLGAQELKAQYGSVRLQFLQMEVAAFVEEALDIKAHIMLQMFQPETLVMRSNIEMTQDRNLIEPAMELLKPQDPASAPLWKFRVQVHADSMAVPEFNAERDGRMAYMRMVAEFMTAIAPMAQSQPGSVPYFLKMLQWAAASFRTGRTIEGVLDEAVAAAIAAQQQPTPPDPKLVAEVKVKEAQALKTTAEAVGTSIENKHKKDNPESMDPKPATAPGQPKPGGEPADPIH